MGVSHSGDLDATVVYLYDGQSKANDGPGIYYLAENEDWTACPAEQNSKDAGVVLTIWDPARAVVEMAFFRLHATRNECSGFPAPRRSRPVLAAARRANER